VEDVKQLEQEETTNGVLYNNQGLMEEQEQEEVRKEQLFYQRQ